MLQIRGLNQFYGGSHTLWDVDLTVPEGSRTCLMGRNGMGKTTTVRSIMGLTPATAGSIRFGGREIAALPSFRVAKLGVGLVPEGGLGGIEGNHHALGGQAFAVVEQGLEEAVGHGGGHPLLGAQPPFTAFAEGVETAKGQGVSNPERPAFPCLSTPGILQPSEPKPGLAGPPR